MNEGSENCVFCRIISRELPADIVYETDLTVAFWDANPARPTHILIVPKEHIRTLNDVPEDDDIVSRLATAAAKIAADFGIADYGYRFFINVNKGGRQEVFHLHAHLLSGMAPE
jgi:histidine triad (HIT) family protein